MPERPPPSRKTRASPSPDAVPLERDGAGSGWSSLSSSLRTATPTSGEGSAGCGRLLGESAWRSARFGGADPDLPDAAADAACDTRAEMWIRRRRSVVPAHRHERSRRDTRRLLLFAGARTRGSRGGSRSRLGSGSGRAGDVRERRGLLPLPESIRGADVFIVQTGSPPVNDHLVELLVMADAARLASAHRITAVMPLLPVRPPGQEVGAARADQRQARRRAASRSQASTAC